MSNDSGYVGWIMDIYLMSNDGGHVGWVLSFTGVIVYVSRVLVVT